MYILIDSITISKAIAKNPDVPILGVCLGHQALGYYYNASVTLAPCGPIHGLISKVRHKCEKYDESSITNDTGEKTRLPRFDLFQDIPQDFDVVRYHSLVVEFPEDENELKSLEIEPIAWCTNDNASSSSNDECIQFESELKSKSPICMGLRHKHNPHYGVQFHPESVGTGEMGYKIFRNFCQFCLDYHLSSVGLSGKNHLIPDRIDHSKDSRNAGSNIEQRKKGNQFKVFIHKINNDLDNLPSPETVFQKLYASNDSSFWLDSSTGRRNADFDSALFGGGKKQDECPIVSNSRFSIMGGDDGPLCKKIEYWGFDHPMDKRGVFVYEKDRDETKSNQVDSDLISYMNKELEKSGIDQNITLVDFKADGTVHLESCDTSSIPFEFTGGYVGFLGYEMRFDTERSRRTEVAGEANEMAKSNPNVPTAAFLFADRSLLYDHWRGEWYAIGVANTNQYSIESECDDCVCAEEVMRWLKDISHKLQSMVKQERLTTENRHVESAVQQDSLVEFKLDRCKEQYVKDIARCHDEIKNGESYELCLTNQFKTTLHFADDKRRSRTPFGLYQILRRRNPSPFAAFMNLNGSEDNEAKVSICCSSPERFLSVTKGRNASPSLQQSHGWEFAPPFVSKNHDNTAFLVESKPIKGTSKRVINDNYESVTESIRVQDLQLADELQSSVKNRAENLMIVDLLRNDLSRVCEPGSVHVPKLMAIESFKTVHQMVSTIRGKLNKEKSPIDVLSACFPGGSMTGAPKLRSVDILHQMEGRARGPYSGSLGYISLNGSMDMNIIIRTAILTPGTYEPDKSFSWDVEIGAGGAITALSESEDEFDEMHLKAKAIKDAIIQWHNDNIYL